jgi:NAD(P)-dependent dehydrogenase (short-subunit alcohol dehydrogenase family)
MPLKSHWLIVGGTKGLGKALAVRCAEQGATVSTISRSAPVGQVPGVKHWSADLTNEEQLRQALDAALEANGPLNYLIFAQRYRGPAESWNGEFAVSVNATRCAIEQVRHQFADGDKAVVAVGSIYADMVGPTQALSYHIAKAALHQMVRYYAVYLKAEKIRVNAVVPLTFLKDESRHVYLSNKPLLELYERIVPAGRMGFAHDSVNAIEFLCSDRASFINGQIINVDGGMSVVWAENLARDIAGL